MSKALTPTLFLRAGHHSQDPGAVANGYAENKLTMELRDCIAKELHQLGVQPDVDKDELNLVHDMAYIHMHCKPQDLLLDIHFNAGPAAATGTECFVAIGANGREMEIATELARVTSFTLDIPDRHRFNGHRPKSEAQSQHGRLAVLRPNCHAVLWEVCFITNTGDLASYFENQGPLAKAITKTIAHYV